MKSSFSLAPALRMALIAGLAASPFSVSASSWFVAPQASTLGFSAQAGYRSDSDFGVRTAWNQFEFDRTFKIGRVQYDADIQLKSMGLLFDYYPWKSGIHLTGGLYHNRNEVSGTGTINGETPMRIGNRIIQVDGRKLGKSTMSVSYAPVAPYVGIGYHNVTKTGFSFTADVGVLYQGRARVELEPPEHLRHSKSQRVRDGIAQQKQEIEKRANKARLLPVASIGVAYTF